MTSDLYGIETPAVLLDAHRMEANLTSMQRLADTEGVALRPHIKTHKSLEIGRRQLALGAVGVTVASIDEALVFLEGGFTSVTIARPVVTPAKFGRLMKHPEMKNTDLRIVVDSQAGYSTASSAAAGANKTLGIFVKIDVGLHRCGILPDDGRLLTLAKQIDRDPGLDFRGVLSHAGHGYASKSRQEAAQLAEEERVTMLGVRDMLRENGIAAAEVSIGATPTVLASESFEGITEIRPGNYVFLDLLPVNAGVAALADVSFSVLATVISRNDQYFITDAGSKTLTSDAGVHGMTGTRGFGTAYPAWHFLSAPHALTVEKVSEEHGMLGRTDYTLEIGDQVRIIPNHSCPVANLAREYIVMGPDSRNTWPVDAAKCSR